MSGDFIFRLYDVLELLKVLSLCRGFCIRLVSVQSGSEVSLRDVKYLCNSHLFLSEDLGLLRLFVAVRLVSVVFEGLRLEL